MQQLTRPIALSLLLCFMSSGVAACERVPLSSPGPLQTIAERQPVLRWLGEAGQRYRVQVAALLPEARVVALHDVEVMSTDWRWPQPLPVERASIKVQVSRQCPHLDTQDLLAMSPAFFVDVRPGCTLDSGSLQPTATGLRWAPLAQAQRYSVRVFDREAFRSGDSPVALSETTLPEAFWPWIIPLDATRHVVSIQAMCQGQPGRPIAWP